MVAVRVSAAAVGVVSGLKRRMCARKMSYTSACGSTVGHQLARAGAMPREGGQGGAASGVLSLTCRAG